MTSCMKKLLIPVALLALAATPSAVLAKKPADGKKRTTVLRGAFSPLAGKAQLTDNKRKDKVQVHVRSLVPGAAYTWALHRAPAGTDPCAAPESAPVAGFTYRPAVADAEGHVTSQGRSSGYSYDAESVDYVTVLDPAGAVVACAVLKTKAQLKREKAEAKGKGRGRGRGRHAEDEHEHAAHEHAEVEHD